MNLPLALKQFRAHTATSSVVDALAYRNGRIDITMQLCPDKQAEFEKRADNLKLRFETCIKAAQDDYEREIRKMFVEFGQVAEVPPIELTKVVSKIDQRAAE